MAISNDVTTNRLNKKINYGVARTEMDSVIGPTGEAMGSPVFNPSNDLWINSDQLPASFLGTSVNTSDMLVYQYTSSASGAGTADGETVGVLELKAASGTDVTYGSGNYATYIACTNRSSAAATRLQDWIPFGFFGATYLTSFAVATEGYHLTNTNLSATAAYYSQIYPSSSGYEFYFDTDAGLLVFAGSSGPPSNLTAGRSIYLIKGARYQGPKGVANMPVSKLSDIHTATPSDSDVLIWDNGNSRWAPGTSLTKVDIGEANVTVANIATLYTTTLQVGTGTTTITTDDVKTGVINLTTANIATAYITSSATIFKEDVEESNVTVANVSTLYVTTAVGGEAVLDEDNMASDSATKLATQQSIKAYVDTQILTEDTIEELNDTTITSATENDVLTYRGGAWINSTEVDLAEANVTVTNVSTAYITTEATIATAKVSDLTSGRVVLAGTSGELEDSASLTFDGTVLTSPRLAFAEANITVANIATAYITSSATIFKEDVEEANITVANIATLYTTTLQVGSGTTTVTTDDVKTTTINLTTLNTATAFITTAVETQCAKVFDLTDGRVTYASAMGELVDSSNLTFDGTVLTSTEVTTPEANVTVANIATAYITTEATIATAKVSDLTDGRVVLAGTSGELEDSGALIFDGTVLTSTEVTTPEANVTVANVTTLYVPSTATIGDLTVDNGVVIGQNLTVSGNVTIQGGATTIESTTLTVDDKNIELGTVDTPTDVTADGGGITLKGTSDKTILWTDSTDSWDVNQDLNIDKTTADSALKIDGTFIANTSVVSPSTKLTAHEANVTSVNTSSLYVTTDATVATAKISDLTSGRVVLAGTSGELEDSGNLTFDGTVLTSPRLAFAEANVTVANVATLYVPTIATIFKTDIEEANITVANIATLYTTTLQVGTGTTTVTSDDVKTGVVNVTTSNISTAYITTEATIATAKVSDLTSGRVVLAGTGGELEDHTNLTFDGTVLTSTEVTTPEANVTVANIATAYITTDATIATAKISDLTSGRVVLAGTSGEIEDSTNLTFDGTVLTSTELTTPEANITVANVSTLYVTTSVGGEAILDDDSFATASATTLATSESIKAYVDAEILTEDTIAELNDTTISPGLAENDVLTYRGGAWINSNEVDLAEANITVVNVATLYSTSSAVMNDVDITKVDIVEANVTVANVATLYSTSSAVMNDVDITKVDIGEANVTVSNTVTTWITDYLCVEAGGYGAYINSKLHTPEANITVANVSTAYVTNKATVQNLDVDVRLAGSPAPVGMGCVPEANIAVANIATLHITTDSTIATAKISDLTDGRVVLAGTSGELEDSTNLTFDGTVLTSTEVTTPEANITVANVATLYVTSQIDKLDIAEVDIAEANVTVGNVATLYVPGDGGPTNLALNVGDGAITINTDDFTTSLSANATLQGTTQITQLNSSTVTESGITVAQYGGALGTPTNKVWANSSGLHYQTKQLAGTDDATALAIALG